MELLKLKENLDDAMRRAEAARRSEKWFDLSDALDDAAQLAEQIGDAMRETHH